MVAFDKTNVGDNQVAVPCAEIRVTGLAPAIVISGPRLVRVYDPQGISHSTRDDFGAIEVAIDEGPLAGTPNQPWVLKSLSQAMTASGQRVHRIETGGTGKKEAGEDGIFWLGDSGETRIAVQVVMAPIDPTIWKAVSKEPTKFTLTVEGAADWIHAAIETKRRKIALDQRKAMILAIDVRHFSMFTDSDVAMRYAEKYGDTKLGFFAVWLVGPVTPRCRRLDAG